MGVDSPRIELPQEVEDFLRDKKSGRVVMHANAGKVSQVVLLETWSVIERPVLNSMSQHEACQAAARFLASGGTGSITFHASQGDLWDVEIASVKRVQR